TIDVGAFTPDPRGRADRGAGAIHVAHREGLATHESAQNRRADRNGRLEFLLCELRLLARLPLLRAAFAVVECLELWCVLPAQLLDGGVAALASGESEARAELAFRFACAGRGFQRV